MWNYNSYWNGYKSAIHSSDIFRIPEGMSSGISGTSIPGVLLGHSFSGTHLFKSGKYGSELSFKN